MNRQKKEYLICVAILVITILFYGCGIKTNKGLGANKAQDKLTSMQSYACIAEVTHRSEEGKNTYKARQIYQIDGKYKVEVIEPTNNAGLITMFDGENIVQYNPNIAGSKTVKLEPNEFRNQVFLGAFVHNYLQSEDVELESEKIHGQNTVVLEALIPGGSSYMTSQKLWLDEDSHKPIRMSIYDKNDKETVSIEFLEFTYNPQFKEGAFKLEE